MFSSPRLLAAALLALVATAANAATVVMRDDFSSRASGWHDNGGNAADARGFSTYTPTGKYQMSPVHDGTVGVMLAPRQAASENVRVETDVFMYAGIGAGAAGVVCRYRDHDNLYAFLVTGQPGWMILRVQGGKATRIAQGALPASPVAGSVDTTLKAECDGQKLRLSVGGRLVGEARDAALYGGASGLIVMGEKLAGTNAAFDDFALSDLGGAARANSDEAAQTVVHTSPTGPEGGVVARIATDPARGGGGGGGGDAERPARVGSLKPGEALVVVEHAGFQGEAVIGLFANGRLKLLDQYDAAPRAGLNLQITLSGDSAYANLRTSTTASSQIANWDVSFDAANQSVQCKRLDIYREKLGVLSLWNYKGERICRIL